MMKNKFGISLLINHQWIYKSIKCITKKEGFSSLVSKVILLQAMEYLRSLPSYSKTSRKI